MSSTAAATRDAKDAPVLLLSSTSSSMPGNALTRVPLRIGRSFWATMVTVMVPSFALKASRGEAAAVVSVKFHASPSVWSHARKLSVCWPL